MNFDLSKLPKRLFGPNCDPPGYLAARWLFLRGLGLIFFSVFYSLLTQIRGLIGPKGLLPVGEYLPQVAQMFGKLKYWYAPTLFWWSSNDRALMITCWIGLIASVLLILNVWPRGMLAICVVTFLSFVSAAQDFSGYQSDGMLLEAGFISLFFAPPGFWPGWGSAHSPSRASRYLLIWEWFRIYFESGLAKILGHDPQWRNFTAMDQYYQNGPLPTWIAWYAEQRLPHWFQAGATFLTLALELVLVFAVFLPRRSRIVLFFIVTPWQIGIILTSNYAFLNYLVLILGFLLVDDQFLARLIPGRVSETAKATHVFAGWRAQTELWLQAVLLVWVFYATLVPLQEMLAPSLRLPVQPAIALEPFRIANRYGLFAVMTPARYEIEFQGSRDGVNWTPYSFRYKPQDVHTPPGLYAPYQPRFDWNLWFASLGDWQDYYFVLVCEYRLLSNDPDVLALFAGSTGFRRPKKSAPRACGGGANWSAITPPRWNARLTAKFIL